MSDFPLVSIQGLFYPDSRRGGLMAQTEDGCSSVASLLQPLEGKRVQLVAHHDPPNGPKLGQWGLGSCGWAPADCPFGHHKNPQTLYRVSARGSLTFNRGQWEVEGHLLNLDALEGHHGRLLAALLDLPTGVKMDSELITSQLGNVQEILRSLDLLRGKS